MTICNEKAAQSLRDARQWAKAKIDGGQEPPWAWYQYMKLIETADAILTSLDSTVTTENLQQLEQRPDTRLRLVGPTYQQDSVPHHPSSVPVHLPM